MTKHGSTSGVPPEEAAALTELLRAERDRTSVRAAELGREFDAIVESAALEATDDEHDPEGSTIGFERAQVAALIEQARRHLEDLDRALRRLHEGTYGLCERCGNPIGFERLKARPAAVTCIRCASRSRGLPGRR